MPWLKNLRAPDLSDLPVPIFNEYVLNRVFLGSGPSDRMAPSYVTNLIHVTDKALREYRAGRDLLSTYMDSANRTRLLIEGLGHFETCINSVKRALRFVERLAAHPVGPEVDRIIRRLLDSYGQRLTPLRDAVEHMDNFLASGELREGASQILSIDPEGEVLEIADSRLSLSDLATLLRRLHELATQCARFKEESSGSGTG